MRFLAVIAIISIGLSSCTGSSKTTTDNKGSNNTGRIKMACADVHVDMNTPHLDWVIENNSVLNKSDQVLVLPKDYKVYSIDSTQLVTFFNAINKGENSKTIIPLPNPADCQLFTMNNNVEEGTYVPKGMMAAKGESMGQMVAASYYNGDFTAHVNWFDIKYEVMTVRVLRKPYFIVYAKQPPPENKNYEKDPAKTTPEIREIRYDR